MMETRTLTLVVQRVGEAGEPVAREMALALLEYAVDCLNGTGGNGQFERHITANGCRIEAIASVPPAPGAARREGLAGVDAADALRDRLQTALEMTAYLPGGEYAGEVAAAIGYDPETAARELREKIGEALEAL